MTIDEMMAEMRKTHPGTNLTLFGHRNRYRVTDMAGVLYGESCSKYEAVYSALKAVRKARPKPMTVAQEKAAVKAKHKSAWAGKADATADNGPPWFIWVGGLPNPLARGHTQGQAWKAAAAAIRAEGGAGS